MALMRGAKRIYDWLADQKAGAVISREEVMEIAGWKPASLQSYISKNKITEFLMPHAEGKLRVMLDGSELSETYFDESFTQTSPRKISLAAGHPLEGESDSYELIDPLGNGAVGHVWSARAKNSSPLVAAKVMLPRGDLLKGSMLPNVRERFRREAKRGKALSHPNIVQYFDRGDAQKNPFLIMELANRCVSDTLKTGPIPEEETAQIVENCINGLLHLHSKECTHRDVKPANILEFPDTFKLGDLGIVRWSDFDEAFTHGGTITREDVQLGSWFYMAPEQQESPHNATPASDTYSLGVTWIEMLLGTLPSPQAIGASAYSLPDIQPTTQETIRAMVSYAPTKRPRLEDIAGLISNTY